MKKFILFFFITYAHTYSQGLNFVDKESLNDLEVFEPQNFGFTENLPQKYSLEKYVPPVGDQKNSSTCMGWALGYYAISTMHNIKFNRTSFAEKAVHSFDPYYAYSMAGSFEEDFNCDSGLNMIEAMRLFSNFGGKKNFFKPVGSCDLQFVTKDYEKFSSYVDPYQLESFSFIQNWNRNYVDNVKKSIYAGKPVIVGLNLTDSFELLYKQSSSSKVGDLWTPDEDKEFTGGHAVCVIAYDDKMYGGSFRVVNSWGTNYADSGYFWIKYDDLANYSDESYNITPAFIDEMEPNISSNFVDNYIYYINKNGNYKYEGIIDENGMANGYGIESWIHEGLWIYSVGLFEDDKAQGPHIVVDDNLEMKVIEFDKGEPQRTLGFSSPESEASNTEHIQSIIPKMKLKSTLQSDIDGMRMKSVGKWKIRKKIDSKDQKIDF